MDDEDRDDADDGGEDSCRHVVGEGSVAHPA